MTTRRAARTARPAAVALAVAAGLAAAGCDGAPGWPGDDGAPTPWAAPAVEPPAPPLALAEAAAAPPATAPVADAGARCGRVDRFDAPLGAPEGSGFQVRWPFGRVSNRYDGKLHAGEDWLALGGDSFGQPIASVAHGEVIYAQPWGWGTDQGVIIVRHHFGPGRVDADGRPLTTVLSFYGHVDPPSVAVARGQCVVRGQHLANIGKPRGRAHLHFEIRDHLPDTPGPGYWPTDPTRVGWHDPSAFILRDRLLATPGVRWLAPFTPTHATALGPAADGPLVVQSDGRTLLGVAPDDGRSTWRVATAAPVLAAALDVAGDAVYAAHPDGLAAYRLAGAAGAAADVPAWTWPWPVANGSSPAPSGPPGGWPGPAAPARPALVALPEGGVAVAAAGGVAALDRAGVARWHLDAAGDVTGLAASDRFVVVAGAGQPGAWPAADGSGRTIVRPGLAGVPAVAGDGAFVLAPDGLTWLSLVAPEPPRHHPLSAGHLDAGQLLVTDDGGALVTHRGSDDRRLLRFAADGRLAWARDLGALGRRLPRLVRAGGAVYLVGARGDISAVDPATGAAARLFAGLGAADADRLAATPWAAALADGTVVARLPLGDGQLVAFAVPGAAVSRRPARRPAAAVAPGRPAWLGAPRVRAPATR